MATPPNSNDKKPPKEKSVTTGDPFTVEPLDGELEEGFSVEDGWLIASDGHFNATSASVGGLSCQSSSSAPSCNSSASSSCACGCGRGTGK